MDAGSPGRVPASRTTIAGVPQDLLLGGGAVVLFAIGLFLLIFWRADVTPMAGSSSGPRSLPSLMSGALVTEEQEDTVQPPREPAVFGSLVLSRNDVQLRASNALHWSGARYGQKLYENDMLQTGTRSWAVAQAREGWRLSLAERSLVRLERRENNRLGGFSVPLAVLLKGELEGELSNASTAPLMVVQMNGGVLSVRSPKGRAARYSIQRQADNTVSASIFSGTAEYRKGSRTVTIRAQQGFTVGADGTLLSIIDLPAAPKLGSPGRGAVVNAIGAEKVVTFDWQGVPAATSYRLQVARDADFREQLVDTQLTETRYDASGLGGGRYYWRVRSLAGVIQGEPTAASVFRVIAEDEAPQPAVVPVVAAPVEPEGPILGQPVVAALRMEFDRTDAPADGQSAVRVTVHALDPDGRPAAVSKSLSVEATGGRLQLPGRPTDETRVGRGDLDRVMPGIQVPLVNGVGRFTILAPHEPQHVDVRVTLDAHEAEGSVYFEAPRRPLLATGFIEANAALRSKAAGTGRYSDFERELGRASGTFSDGKGTYASSGAMFAKGEIGKGYLLTLAYDSERANQSPYFRDIRPEEFYPIRGDASIQGFEAQSTDPLYLRLERNRSYLVYGDYVTGSTFAPQALGGYARTVTGLRHHLEGERGLLDTFASQSSARQIVEEQPARGVSGPYYVRRSSGLRNSEKVEILTRSRNQPAVILAVRPMQRFVDYTFEPFSGQIVFMAPVASVDADFNPQTIRVTYEADEGGDDFWLAGADGQLRITDSIAVGGSYVEDQDPVRPFRLYSANTTLNFGRGTVLWAEGAASDDDADRSGNAARVELRHTGTRLNLQALWGRTDPDFDNPSATLQPGREEALLNLSFQLLEGTSLRAEVLRSEDRTLNAERQGMFAGIEQRLGKRFTVDAGVRQSRDEGGPVNAGAAGITNIPLGQGFTPYQINAPGIMPATEFADFTAWHLGARAQLTEKSQLFAEVEQDVDDSSKSRYAIGADYRIADRARIYARHEDLSSTSGPYGLTGDDRSTTSTLVGLDTSYLENGQMFSELRLRDAISGREAHAAFGLRHLWTPSEGLRISGGFERQQAMGERDTTATALSGGVEFTQNPLWRAATRLELRRDDEYDAVLSTAGYVHKINRDWSFIARNYLNWAAEREGSSASFLQDRLQLGFAFRQTDTNVWSALGRYERIWEEDETGLEDIKRTADIVSAHVSMHPNRTLWLSGRLAAKWVDEEFDGTRDDFDAYLAGFRVVHDFSKRWDLGFQSQALFQPDADAMQYSLGPEVGYLLMENLWFSLGYNFAGFEDRDLAATEYTNEGAYLRFRFKFDEDLFGRGRRGVDPSVTPAPERGE